mgnify:CR=1 FL=1
MTETPVSEMDFKLRLDLAGEAFDLREVARLVAELKAGKGTLAEFCDVWIVPSGWIAIELDMDEWTL